MSNYAVSIDKHYKNQNLGVEGKEELIYASVTMKIKNVWGNRASA